MGRAAPSRHVSRCGTLAAEAMQQGRVRGGCKRGVCGRRDVRLRVWLLGLRLTLRACGLGLLLLSSLHLRAKRAAIHDERGRVREGGLPWPARTSWDSRFGQTLMAWAVADFCRLADSQAPLLATPIVVMASSRERHNSALARLQVLGRTNLPPGLRACRRRKFQAQANQVRIEKPPSSVHVEIVWSTHFVGACWAPAPCCFDCIWWVSASLWRPQLAHLDIVAGAAQTQLLAWSLQAAPQHGEDATQAAQAQDPGRAAAHGA